MSSTASAYSSRNDKYELMTDVIANDNNNPETWDIYHRPRKQMCCTKYTIGFFLIGLLSGAGILLLGLHIASESPSPSHPSPKNNSRTVLGCSSFADIKILVNDATEIIPHQTTCGHQALGNVNKFETCFEKATGLSTQCATCYGGITKCGQDKCLAECILGPSAKCSKCVCAKCRQTFRECMQVPCTIIPHNQWKCDDCPGSN